MNSLLRRSRARWRARGRRRAPRPTLIVGVNDDAGKYATGDPDVLQPTMQPTG